MGFLQPLPGTRMVTRQFEFWREIAVNPSGKRRAACACGLLLCPLLKPETIPVTVFSFRMTTASTSRACRSFHTCTSASPYCQLWRRREICSSPWLFLPVRARCVAAWAALAVNDLPSLLLRQELGSYVSCLWLYPTPHDDCGAM